jgi:hypothetical protein
MIVELQCPLPVDTPKGRAVAHFLLDYGRESDLYWICFINETGENWVFRQSQIRLAPNVTEGTNLKSG